MIPVPDTGMPAAIGYAAASGIPYAEGLIKNRYVHRTFIQPDDQLRQVGIRMKLNPLSAVIRGKRLVVVDDSIVRGNTTGKLVDMLCSAGATEVHLRISSPPIQCPCYYGIDMATRAELIAANMSVEEIRAKVGATSLHYLTLDGLQASTGLPREPVLPRLLRRRLPHRRARGVRDVQDALREGYARRLRAVSPSRLRPGRTALARRLCPRERAIARWPSSSSGRVPRRRGRAVE